MGILRCDAFIALRLAMKTKEVQSKMYAEPLFPYQAIYNRIVQLIWTERHELLGNNIPQQPSEIEELINSAIQMRELQLLISCDWNLKFPLGNEIFESVLKLANH